MKATIINVREGSHKTAERHTVVVTFSEKRENVDGITALMMTGILAGGVTSYEATFDLVRIIAAMPTEAQEPLKTNGVYDTAKAYQFATTQLFKIGAEIEHELFNLFAIPILEVSDGKYSAVNVKVGENTRTMSVYRRAGFFDRETCLSICKSAFATNVANGTFVPIESVKQEPQQSQINLATLLGGANTPT